MSIRRGFKILIAFDTPAPVGTTILIAPALQSGQLNLLPEIYSRVYRASKPDFPSENCRARFI